MPDYKAMYFELFNRVTDVIGVLQSAQQEGENAYVESKTNLFVDESTENEE